MTTLLTLLLGRRVGGGNTPPEPPFTLYPEIWPANDWDGVPTAAIWTQETITSGAPSAQTNFSVHETIHTDGRVFCVSPRISTQFGTISKVEAACGNRIVELTVKGFYNGDSLLGRPERAYGYLFKAAWAKALAISEGLEDVYFKITPSNPLMQARVIGPYRMNFRATEADKYIKVAMTPGFSGATTGYDAADCIKKALNYASTHASELVHVELIENTEYDWDPITTITNLQQKAVVKRATGCTATLGDGTKASSVSWQVGNVELRGLELVLNRMSYALSWVIYIPDGFAITMRECEIYSGDADTANGQSGSGAGLLIKQRRPNSAWLGRNSSNNSARYELIGCDLHDLPEYAFAGTSLAYNCTLNNMSGTAAEGLRGYFGWNSITNLSSVDAGYRTYKKAIGAITAPAGSMIEKVGLNGANSVINGYETDRSFVAVVTGGVMEVKSMTGSYDLTVGTYLKGTGVPSGTFIASLGSGTGGTGTYILSTSASFNLSERTIVPAKYKITVTISAGASKSTAEIAATINTWVGWSATSDAGNNRDATYLVLNNGTPAQGFVPTAIGTSLDLYTIIDAHTNFAALVISAVTPDETNASFSNLVIEFNVIPRVTTAGSFATGDKGRKLLGVAFCNNILHDASLAEGMVVQQGRFGGIAMWSTFEYNTFINVGMQFLSSYESRGDYVSVSRNILKTLDQPGGNTASLVIKENMVHSASALPAGADASNVNLGNSALLTTIFEDPSNDNIMLRARPKVDGPALRGTVYAGALLPTSMITEANPEGWNVAA